MRLGGAAFEGVCFWAFSFLRYLWIGGGNEDSNIDDICVCCVVCIEGPRFERETYDDQGAFEGLFVLVWMN